jgi:endonuclease YncB( thermonuclease family)
MTLIGHLCVWLGLCIGDITGPVAYVVDGDTIRIDGRNIRLQGVDAEELSEPNGHAARDIMQGIVASRIVSCSPDGTSSYGRIVARCYIDGIDIAIPLIAGGWALDCPAFSGGRYRPYELKGARSFLIQKGYCR